MVRYQVLLFCKVKDAFHEVSLTIHCPFTKELFFNKGYFAIKDILHEVSSIICVPSEVSMPFTKRPYISIRLLRTVLNQATSIFIERCTVTKWPELCAFVSTKDSLL